MSDELLEKVDKSLQDLDCTVTRWRDRRIGVETTADKLLDVAEILTGRDIGYAFLCTIVGLDLGDKLGIKYILGDRADVITLSITVPYDKPEVPTLTGLLPAATLYEREIHDLLGVVFAGHPNLAPLVLSEDWPEGMYPLRKDFQFYKDGEGKPVRGCLLEQADNLKKDIEEHRKERKSKGKKKK